MTSCLQQTLRIQLQSEGTTEEVDVMVSGNVALTLQRGGAIGRAWQKMLKMPFDAFQTLDS